MSPKLSDHAIPALRAILQREGWELSVHDDVAQGVLQVRLRRNVSGADEIRFHNFAWPQLAEASDGGLAVIAGWASAATGLAIRLRADAPPVAPPVPVPPAPPAPVAGVRRIRLDED